jgi:hypothetical protein
MRWLSFWLAVWAWTFLTVIGLIHFVEETPQIKDLGDFAVLCILPILIGLQAQRKDLIYKILALCAVAALADAAWNAATYLRFVQPIKDTGRLTAYGMMKRYPGLTGSTLAGGLISFLGVCFLAFRFSTSRWLGLRPFILLALGAIFIDMLLIDARRYTGVSIVACFILMTPWVNRRAPLQIIAVVVAGLFLYLTLASDDPENVMRGDLTAAGWEDAMRSFWLGDGVHHYDWAEPNFQDLWSAGITESGFVDLAKAYGVPSAVAFVLAGLAALAASRRRITAVAATFAMLLATLENEIVMVRFLSASVFYLASFIILFEERLTRRMGMRLPVAARALEPAPHI